MDTRSLFFHFRSAQYASYHRIFCRLNKKVIPARNNQISFIFRILWEPLKFVFSLLFSPPKVLKLFSSFFDPCSLFFPNFFTCFFCPKHFFSRTGMILECKLRGFVSRSSFFLPKLFAIEIKFGWSLPVAAPNGLSKFWLSSREN